MVQQGTRRPLITSAGGIAIIQTLAADEARQVLLNNVAQEIAGHGTMRLHALQKMQERSDHHGWGVNLGDVVPGVNAFAMPVRDARGRWEGRRVGKGGVSPGRSRWSAYY